MEREGEEASEDHVGPDIFEEFSTLDLLWAPRLRFRLISQDDFFCRCVNDTPQCVGGTKEVRLSYHKAIKLSQFYSNNSARPSKRNWKEARKAECEFPDVPASLQRPAGRPL